MGSNVFLFGNYNVYLVIVENWIGLNVQKTIVGNLVWYFIDVKLEHKLWRHAIINDW